VWIDPGYQGAYAVLAMQIAGEVVRQIDEVYARGIVVPDIIRECKARPWWRRVRGGVIDIAGAQHQGMESHVEAWHRLAGLGLRYQPVGIADGILRHRTFLADPATGQPRLFHDPRCVNTIREYGLYRYMEVKENRPEREEPIDANNHAMKAIAYGLVANFGLVSGPRRPRPMKARIRG